MYKNVFIAKGATHKMIWNVKVFKLKNNIFEMINIDLKINK